MRILFVVPYTPNQIRVRPYSLIRSLTDRGHQVTVLTLSSGPADQADGAKLAEYCHQVISLPLSRWRSLWNCLVALPSRRPLQSVYSWQPELADQLDVIADGQNGQMPFDVAHVEHLRGARYGLHLLEKTQLNNARLPIVWDSVDCISYLFEQAADQSESLFGRWVTRFELERTRHYEGWLLSQFNHILVTSQVDKQALIDLSPPSLSIPDISILPNGVDLDYFRPSKQIMRDPATLVVSGKMSYHANVTMVLYLVRKVMPFVWSSRPDVKLMIVGKDPSSDIQKLDQHPAITVTGMVKDMRPYLQKATVAVAPLTYGAGVQNKVLEAMACATPVVATPQVTMGLNAVAGQDLLVAQDAADFADRITGLLGDPDRQQAIGANGRAYVESHHQWKTVAKQLEEIYQAAVH